MVSQGAPMSAPVAGYGVQIQTMKTSLIVTFVLLGTGSAATAQEAAWAQFEAGMEASRGQELNPALTLFRRVIEEATETDLRASACYAAADTILKLFERRESMDRALACEGVRHYQCYLHAEQAMGQREAASRATWGRSRLTVECLPSTTLAWSLTGAGAGVLLAGGGLLLSSFADAEAIRGRKAEVIASGTSNAEIGAINADQEGVETQVAVSYGLLGAGAFLAVWAALEWADVSAAPESPGFGSGSGLSLSF
jgi:hypothetical protein